MRDQLEHRLQDLKTEFEAGQRILRDLETRQTNVNSSLLRISGAIQVLEEVLKGKQGSVADNMEAQEIRQPVNA